MEIIPLFWIVSLAFTGLTKGAGVLPDGPLVAAVGGAVKFTPTLTPPPASFTFIDWKFGTKVIVVLNSPNLTPPEYKDRITLLTSTGSLELRNLTFNDSGEYKVTIIPAGQASKDGSTRLEVYERVSNVTATASSTDFVEFNRSVHLSCSSSGSNLTFLWMNGSSEVTASDRVQLTDGGSTLTIVNVTRYDEGPYTCHVSNPVNSDASNVIKLSISYGPENTNLTISPPQEYFGEGSNINLSCSADSRPSATFNWFLNESQLSDTGSDLRLVNIQLSQSGNYSCQAFNQKTLRYETSQPSAITVLERISGASVTPSTKLTVEGNPVNLTCEAAGSVFTRTWKKNGVDLIPSDNIMLHDESRVLSVISLSKTDSGEYSCKISNPFSSEEAKYNMAVIYGPENVKIEGPDKIEVGKKLTLTCSAESTPNANYTWTLNEKDIHSSSVYTKDSTEFSDSGNYICQAMNEITEKTLSAVHPLSVIKVDPCPPGCIVGIVIGCLLVVAAGIVIVYFLHRKKKLPKSFFNRNNGNKRSEVPENTAHSGNEELNYAAIRFTRNKDGGTVQMGVENNTSEYAQVRVNNENNNNGTAAFSPPTYDDHQLRMKRQAPQPGAHGAQVYAQIRKN